MRAAWLCVYCETEMLTECVNATERVNKRIWFDSHYRNNQLAMSPIVLYTVSLVSLLCYPNSPSIILHSWTKLNANWSLTFSHILIYVFTLYRFGCTFHFNMCFIHLIVKKTQSNYESSLFFINEDTETQQTHDNHSSCCVCNVYYMSSKS